MDNEMLIRAFAEVNAERYGEYFNTPKKHKFSFPYHIRKRSIIRSFERGKTEYRPISSRTIRVILIALILSLLALTLGGFCLYFVINGFHFEVHSEYSAVHLEPTDNDKTEISEIYFIIGIDEAALQEQEIVSGLAKSEYIYKNEVVILNQMIPEYKWNVNTENQAAEPIDVNGSDGFYISMNNNTESYLVWKMDGYIFTIGGKITKDEALDLAKSTKIK